MSIPNANGEPPYRHHHTKNSNNWPNLSEFPIQGNWDWSTEREIVRLMPGKTSTAAILQLYGHLCWYAWGQQLVRCGAAHHSCWLHILQVEDWLLCLVTYCNFGIYNCLENEVNEVHINRISQFFILFVWVVYLWDQCSILVIWSHLHLKCMWMDLWGKTCLPFLCRPHSENVSKQLSANSLDHEATLEWPPCSGSWTGHKCP